MRISADGVEEEQICGDCGPDVLHIPQNAKMTIVIKEHGDDEVTKGPVEYMLQKFQNLSIEPAQDGSTASVGDFEKLADVEMEGAEGTSASPPWVPKPSLMPFWKELKEDMKKEIKEDVMKEVRKELDKFQQIKENISEKSAYSTEEVLHYGVYCDSCDQQIRGIRYKCGNCEDFDLCEKCEGVDLQNKHDASHIFLKIRVPSCLFTTQEGAKKKIYQVPLRDSVPVQNDIVLSEKGVHAFTAKKEEAKPCMSAKFIHDESIPDGTIIAPNAEFIKTWRVCNSGTKPWTKDTSFFMLWSNRELKPSSDEVLAPQLKSGEEGLVSVKFTAPSAFGIYESYWEFQHLEKSFGDTFWCRIRVESVQPIEIFPLVVPNRSSALKALKLQHHQCLLKNKRKVKEEKKRKKESRKKDVKQIVDVLTAVHEDQDSCSRNIGQRKSLMTSQTATPNNTPFDLTPPKSPEPDDFVEIKNVVSLAASEASGNQPMEGNLNISTCAFNGDDKASITTLSSSDSESEFVVIPMPRCFSILKPNVDSPVCIPKASLSATEVVAELPEKQVNHKSVSQETDAPQGTENMNLVTTIQLKEDCDKKVIVSNVSLTCSPTSSSVSVVDNNEEISSTAATDSSSTEITDGDHSNIDPHQSNVDCLNEAASDSGRGSSCTFPKFPLNVEPEPIVPAAESTASEDLNDPASGIGVEVLPGNVVQNAIHAATSVYKTARAVILNLQPGRSEEDNTLQPGTPQLTPLEQLLEMGFCNRALNEELLSENRNDVARVVAELVNLNDNEWYASRHSAGSAPPSSG